MRECKHVRSEREMTPEQAYFVSFQCKQANIIERLDRVLGALERMAPLQAPQVQQATPMRRAPPVQTQVTRCHMCWLDHDATRCPYMAQVSQDHREDQKIVGKPTSPTHEIQKVEEESKTSEKEGHNVEEETMEELVNASPAVSLDQKEESPILDGKTEEQTMANPRLQRHVALSEENEIVARKRKDHRLDTAHFVPTCMVDKKVSGCVSFHKDSLASKLLHAVRVSLHLFGERTCCLNTDEMSRKGSIIPMDVARSRPICLVFENTCREYKVALHGERERRSHMQAKT